MQKCEITLSQLGFVSDIDNSENLRRVVRRLPNYMRNKWVDVAYAISETGREPRFSDLAKFVDDRSRVASSMYGLDVSKERTDSQSKRSFKPHVINHGKVTTFTTNTDTKSLKKHTSCYCCKGTCPEIANCKSLASLSLENCYKVVKENKLCFNCLKGKHMSSLCKKPKLCTVSDCSKKQHVLLHSWASYRSDHTATHSVVNNCASTDRHTVKNCLGIIPVTVKDKDGKPYSTYALLDDGAVKSLCDEQLLRKLRLDSKEVSFQISTITSTGYTHSGREVDLQVQSVNGGESVTLNRVWSVSQLPISARSAPTKVDAIKFSHLASIQVPEVSSDKVTLLIGTFFPHSHIPVEVRAGDSNQSYAVRTRLGWAIRGPVERTHAVCKASVNFQQTSDDLLLCQLERMWKVDFSDRVTGNKSMMSVEDKRALQMMESPCELPCVGLPWRNECESLPSNQSLAHSRVMQLKQKFVRNPELHQMYTNALTDYIDKGFAKEVPETAPKSKRTWYLPHHPVTNKNKPGRLLVVFDCTAKYKGVSLNNQLIGVLLRFRQEKVALVGDIEAMLHQVRMRKEDTDALRFLWWPGWDIFQPLKTYAMQVNLFGATSSPSCPAYALKRTTADNAEKKSTGKLYQH